MWNDFKKHLRHLKVYALGKGLLTPYITTSQGPGLTALLSPLVLHDN